MDSTSEKTAQQASGSDEEIIDLVEEVSDSNAETDEEIIELTEALEEATSEDVVPQAEGEGIEPEVEYKDAEEADFLADLGMEIEPDSGMTEEEGPGAQADSEYEIESLIEEPSETVPEAKEAEIDRETILSQIPKEELETVMAHAAKNIIGEIAERIVTEVAEKSVLKEIEKIKSALK